MIFNLKRIAIALSLSSLLALSLAGCSSSPQVKSQSYAQLSNKRTFEHEFPDVWKALEETLRKFKIVDRSPSDVDPIELKRLKERSLKTDWIYGKSQDKYVEYKVNGSPRKTYLQTRYRYNVETKKVLGGVEVTVNLDEEVERLKKDGTPDGYTSADSVNSGLASELLDKLNTAILGAPVI